MVDSIILDFPWGSQGKESACSAGDPKFDPLARKTPWRGEWLPTAVFLPGESHGRRSLAGYSPRGHKDSDTAEALGTYTHVFS